MTEAFTAIDLRLRTLRAARDRLTELLAKAKNENERLQILGEIGRLTEQIDNLELKLDTLARLAAFSRITLELVPKNVSGPRPEEPVAAMRWIWRLSPYRFDVAHRADTLEVAIPEGFVELTPGSLGGALPSTDARHGSWCGATRPEGGHAFCARTPKRAFETLFLFRRNVEG